MGSAIYNSDTRACLVFLTHFTMLQAYCRQNLDSQLSSLIVKPG